MTDCDLLDLNAQVCAGACNYCGDVSVEYGLKRAFDARNYPESCSGKVGGHVTKEGEDFEGVNVPFFWDS